MTKLTSIFSNSKILTTKGKNIPINQINSNQVQSLTNNLLTHLDKLNLAAITPQNIFPNQKQTNLENHLLNILIFRDETGNPITIYNPKISNQSKQTQFVYERCGSIQINQELTFDCYTKRYDIITLSGHNYQNQFQSETSAYIQHELDHLQGLTISDRNKQLNINKLKQIDKDIEPKLIIKEKKIWTIIDRTNNNQHTPNSINFDYIKEFHQGIEKELKYLNKL